MIHILLKKLRLRNGLTQTQLAQIVGVKQPTISRLETDCTHVSWGLISKILIVFNINEQEINQHIEINESNNVESFVRIIYKNPKLRTLINYDPIKIANDIISLINSDIYK